MYISWAAFYEGRTDSSYFNVLLPRILDDVLRSEGVRPYDVALAPSVEFGITDRSFEHASAQICARKAEYHLLFVHADAGGRAQQQDIAHRREALIEAAHQLCNFDIGIAVLLSPQKELEAWAISDHDAVKAAFGISRLPEGLLPATANAAEKVDDPKALLREVGREAGSRRPDNLGILVRIAQEQNIDHLRSAGSFQEFEASLRSALQHIGCI